MKSQLPTGTKIVIYESSKLSDPAYVQQVLDAEYIVMGGLNQLKFTRNSSLQVDSPTNAAARQVYAKLQNNNAIYIDELQTNLDPTSQAINPVGDTREALSTNVTQATTVV